MTRPLRIHRCSLACAAALLAVSGLPNSALAKPSKDQCVDADTQAQDLRRDGKLLSARETLRICVDPACPRLVREDCTQRLDELTSALPSLIFSAKDGAGQDLSAVTVTIDGKPLVDHLDGSALDVDPGEHTFRFEAAELPPATLKLLIREGERGRHAPVLIGPAGAEVAPPASPAGATQADAAAKDAEPEPSSSGRAQRVVAWTALGLGTAGIVVGTVFGLKSKSKHDDAKACGATCPDVPSHDANQDALKFGNISTVAFIVGAVGIASGVTLWLTAKPGQPSSGSSAQVGVGLGSVHLRGSF